MKDERAETELAEGQSDNGCKEESLYNVGRRLLLQKKEDADCDGERSGHALREPARSRRGGEARRTYCNIIQSIEWIEPGKERARINTAVTILGWKVKAVNWCEQLSGRGSSNPCCRMKFRFEFEFIGGTPVMRQYSNARLEGKGR